MARLAVESTEVVSIPRTMTEEEFEAWCNRYITIPFGEGVFHPQVVPGFWLRPDWLWQDPLPGVLNISENGASLRANLKTTRALSLYFAPMAILSVSRSVFESWSRAFMRVFGPENRLRPRLVDSNRNFKGAENRLSRPQLSCGVEALAGEFRLKAPLQVIPCGLLRLRTYPKNCRAGFPACLDSLERLSYTFFGQALRAGVLSWPLW